MTGPQPEAPSGSGPMLAVIRTAVNAHGLRVETIATRVGVQPPTVRAWLRCALAPDLKHLIGLSAVVGLRVVIEDKSAVVGSSVRTRRRCIRVADELNRLVALLRARRVRCGRTQAWVGAALGVTEESVQCWESLTNVPPVARLMRWAQALGLIVRLCVGGWPVAPEPVVGLAVVTAVPGQTSTAVRRARAGIRSW